DNPGRWTIAVAAERFEIDLVQHNRARGDQLFALEAVDIERGGVGPVERRKTRSDGVQSPERAAIVVLVMAYEQPLRTSVHPLGLQQGRPNHPGSGSSHLPGGNRNGFLWVHGRALLVRFDADQRYCPSSLPRRTIS